MKVDESGWMWMTVDEQGWTRMKVDDNERMCIKVDEHGWNGWTLIKVDEMDGNWSKWIEMDESGSMSPARSFLPLVGAFLVLRGKKWEAHEVFNDRPSPGLSSTTSSFSGFLSSPNLSWLSVSLLLLNDLSFSNKWLLFKNPGGFFTKALFIAGSSRRRKISILLEREADSRY